MADRTHVTHGAPATVHNSTYAIPRAQPAHHFIRAYRRCPFTEAGRAWKPAPTVYWERVSAKNRRRQSAGARGVEDAAPYGLARETARRPSTRAGVAFFAALWYY